MRGRTAVARFLVVVILLAAVSVVDVAVTLLEFDANATTSSGYDGTDDGRFVDASAHRSHRAEQDERWRDSGSVSHRWLHDDSSNLARLNDRALAPNTAGLNLPFRDAGLRSQVDDVVRHFDEFGTPPPGVRQGIRSGGERGVFRNVDGTLPRHTDPRYYTEMDVWAGTGPRGTERLVIGRGGEVYYTPNHYENFVRVR